MPLPHRFEVSKDAVSEVLEGEAVVFHLQTGHYFRLNETGARVWELIQKHGEVDQILETMADEFDVEPARLGLDLERLLHQLLEKGLIVRAGGAS